MELLFKDSRKLLTIIMEKTYPKNRTDLLVNELVGEDIRKLTAISMRYRALEEVKDLEHHIKALINILSRV